MENIKITSNEYALSKLLTLLRISTGGFVLCTYSNVDTFNNIFLKLKGKLYLENIKLQDVGTNVSFSDLEKIMLYGEKMKQSKNIEKVIYSKKWDSNDFENAILNYNVRRDFYMPNFGTTVIFWIPQNKEEQLINDTPDFWRVKLSKISFQSEIYEKYHDEIGIKVLMPNEQKEYIRGLVKLQVYYSFIEDLNKSEECDVKIKELRNTIMHVDDFDNPRLIEKLVDLTCDLIEKGFIEDGSIMQNIIMNKCRESSGSVRSVKNEYKDKIKNIYKRLADAYNEGGEYITAGRLYKMIMKNTNVVIDRGLRRDTSKKLDELMPIFEKYLKEDSPNF